MKLKYLLFIFIILSNNFQLFSEKNSEDELLNLAYDAYIKENDNEAYNYANKVLKINPGNIKALFIRSKIYMFRKRYDLSLKDINKTLDLLSDTRDEKLLLLNAQLLRDRGIIFDIQNKPEKALQDFLEVVKINKDDTMINLDIAIAYYNMKDFENSLKYFNTAVDLNPFELSYYNFGIQLSQVLGDNKNLNYYKERANLLYKYSIIFNSKIKNNLVNMSLENYNTTDGVEKYYELIFKNNGDLLDQKYSPIIKIDDILDMQLFSDSFSIIMGNYMLVHNDFSKNYGKKVKIKALKIETFYEEGNTHDLHFIYKVKIEELK